MYSSDVILELKEKRINVGFTNGCFDLLHQGHIDYLKKSKNKCDFLILGLNSDTSIKKIKGSGDLFLIKMKDRKFCQVLTLLIEL